MDLSKTILEVPEQTLEEHQSDQDFEKDDDFSSPVAEVPEQTLEEEPKVQQEADLEEDTEDEFALTLPSQSDKGETVHVIKEKSEEKPETKPETKPENVEPKKGAHVRSDQPKGGKQIKPSTHFSPEGPPLGANLPEDFVNPLVMAHNPQLKHPAKSHKKLSYKSEPSDLHFSSGNYRFSIHQNHAKNFLAADRVQVGTSELGSHSSVNGITVAKYRIRFHAAFATRPMVIVTTVPLFAADVDKNGPHPDVFAASVSEIRTDSFIVNVVRVDSFPNNGWGQKLYLDWIALEYPKQRQQQNTLTGGYLPTFPHFDDSLKPALEENPEFQEENPEFQEEVAAEELVAVEQQQ